MVNPSLVPDPPNADSVVAFIFSLTKRKSLPKSVSPKGVSSESLKGASEYI